MIIFMDFLEALLRTLMLDLRLRERLEAGGHRLPQGSFLAPDGGGGHGRGKRDRKKMLEN